MLSKSFFSGKSILVTGGTGSFGREFIQQALGWDCRRVICFSRDEYKQWKMREEVPQSDRLRWFLGDVRDLERLRQAFRGVDLIVHAAALKHIPSGESNPLEVIKTNVLGANNVIIAAMENRVQRLIALSTDKACNPANLYGASKLCAERMFISSNGISGQGGTRFSIVRYGNVVGSRGSVIPLFLERAALGLPLLVTDRAMTRFLIRIQDAAAFVADALVDMTGGEIFIPQLPSATLGQIVDAIRPLDNIKIPVRPGEKQHEVLFTAAESKTAIEQRLRYIILPESDWYEGEHKGLPVRAGFEYNSRDAGRLRADELAKWVDEVRRSLADLSSSDHGTGHRGGDSGIAIRHLDAGS